ncbi:MAG: hypothetical protein IIX99_01365, partial [Oscillospiraceae bacterium]|nr:hypothetical protein [Oscillospiraceae bacterium]
YFVGGGTGYGVFPVNQRGQTQYTGSGYGVDRWFSSNSRLSIAMNPATGIMSLSASSAGNAFLIQKVAVSAGTHTFSVLVKGSGGAGQLRIDSEDGSTLIGDAVDFTDLSDSWEFFSGTITFDTAQIVRFVIRVNTGKTYDLEAAKLERGSIQTLAHQENGAWVLNSVPRYDEELRRCQNRLWLESNVPSNAYVVTSGVATSATSAIFSLFLPANLAKSSNPTAIFNNIGVYSNTSNASRNVSALSIVSIVGNSVGLTATISGATAGESLRLVVLQGGSIGVSTEV